MGYITSITNNHGVQMNFFKTNILEPLGGTIYLLDLHYTTEENGKTYHWFLDLNQGTKQAIQGKHLGFLQPTDKALGNK